MNSLFVMIIGAYAGPLSSGVAMEKVGVFESEEACNIAGSNAGFKKKLEIDAIPMYYCVAFPDGFGAE